jgi:hypothetical protein
VTTSAIAVAESLAVLVLVACGARAVAPAPPIKQEPLARPFDKDAAATALSKATAAARECSGAADPHGTGRILVSFAAEGHVEGAAIEAGGLTRPDGRPIGTDIRGTSIGNCVEGIFRKARVPPFSGSAVSIRKTFWL